MPLDPSGVPSRAAIQDAINEAAAAIEDKRQQGAATITVTASTSGSQSVVFPTPFAATPRIQVTNAGGTGASVFFLTTSARTPTGFTVNATKRDTTNVDATIIVEWSAAVD